ncbi:MAG: zf-HC2 domain-containing protein [Chloroflexi bacterium]|nr:zf-HC2 domain-containing protein [Chloroflexota bacterium]
MSEHVIAWITAYHDGELYGARLFQVETHLRDCSACRAELEALKALSGLLQKNPAMPARTTPERFVAQVRLRTRPHPAQRRTRQAGWLIVPLSLLGIWAFLQAVLLLSRLVLMALPLSGGLLGAQTEWFPGQRTAQLFVLDTAFTAVLAALLWGWLAGWWAAHSKHNRSADETAG